MKTKDLVHENENENANDTVNCLREWKPGRSGTIPPKRITTTPPACRPAPAPQPPAAAPAAGAGRSGGGGGGAGAGAGAGRGRRSAAG